MIFSNRFFLCFGIGLVSAQFVTVTTHFASSATEVIIKNGSEIYKPLFERHSNATPVFINSTGISPNPLIKALLGPFPSLRNALQKREDNGLPVGTCAPGIPCSNGACCSNTGVCSYEPTSCAPDVCISNCDAKAPCGKYADPANAKCRLNVCCSKFGFCGATDDFCGPGCQSGYGTCGPAMRPSCAGRSTSKRTIGYYESWVTTRICDKRDPEDLDLTGLTHINFAFAFFHPTTFQIAPMNPGDPELYTRFTALKSKKPSLSCFISIGGWSFNDETNFPNTRTAFSDMVATPANRAAFISSLTHFLQTYNFDGVDLDWEYPAADDRGGVAADIPNFVIFLRELRQAFGTRYGITATIPNSFWYLQGFDVKNIQEPLDWLNVMSYDIHGTWDSSNKFTGPYIRPHTNLTEIKEGLDLLWRAGVTPDKVVLGLGWYGRSFTLLDPSCNEPNGACIFTAGADPGECSGNSGTLTNAEIKRIIAKGGVKSGFDREAAVKWITWNSNQWVSYDDGETTQLKVQAADQLCLSGTMIWAIDQDDINGSSMNDLLGIGTSNGVSPADAAKIKEQLNNATLAAEVANSCYWTLCGDDCTVGYFPATQSQGQVAGTIRDSTCPAGQFSTLCCAPGTTMGACRWEGWRGVGLPCSPSCENSDDTIVARNTNHYDLRNGQLEDQTCNGGYQTYCCSGFKPSTKTNTGNLILYGQGGIKKRSVPASILEKRSLPDRMKTILGAVACGGLALIGSLVFATPTGGTSIAGVPGIFAACVSSAAIGYTAASGSGHARILRPRPLGKLKTPFKPIVRHKSKASPKNPLKKGNYDVVVYPTIKQPGCDCSVTYTCKYGHGWDEICDNQRSAIFENLNGNTVYHYTGRLIDRLYSKKYWAPQHHEKYRTLAQAGTRCHVDEFPMGSLREAIIPNPQYVRLVNGRENTHQGNDWGNWLLAEYVPCVKYKSNVCEHKNFNLPVTWAFGTFQPGDPRQTATGFIQKYGFDSQTIGSECWATVDGLLSTITNQGFRVFTDDPIFTAYSYPAFNMWNRDPAVTMTNAAGQQVIRYIIPGDVDDTRWLGKRDVSWLGKRATGNGTEVALYDEESGMINYDYWNLDCDLVDAVMDRATGKVLCIKDLKDYWIYPKQSETADALTAAHEGRFVPLTTGLPQTGGSVMSSGSASTLTPTVTRPHTGAESKIPPYITPPAGYE